MGADYVGFIGRELQAPLGVEGFLQHIKLRAYKRAVEEQVPPAQRANVRVTVSTNGRTRELTWSDLVTRLGDFERGCPSCATCIVGGGAPVGCYRFVTYPVDAKFEALLFDFFVSERGRPDSIGDQFLEIALQQGHATAWHPRPSNLAAGPKVLRHGHLFSRVKFDSAQLLAAFFLSSRGTRRLDETSQFALLVAFSRLVTELVDFARRTTPPGASRTLDEVAALVPFVLGVVASTANGGGTLFVDA